MQIPDRYRIIRSIGLGATSEVFEAVNSDTGKRVALKSFSPLILNDPESVQRLEAEVSALNQLRHPNIVSLHGTSSEPGFFALELELVEGSDLRKWSQNYDLGLLEPKIWLLAQVARGLGAAHEIGVLHRDLKPENVLVSNDGDVKITDFGLSRSISRLTLTRIGLLVGSLGYMSPECINGLRANVRSDLFSYGVIAYELLTGRAPFEADTPQALIKQITEGRFTPIRQLNSSLTPEVASTLEACLSQDPDKRPESIWTVEAALMTSLQSTRVLPLCRALVAPATRIQTLPQALAVKHDSLHERIQRIGAGLKLNPNDTTLRSSLLASLHELRELFPEDPTLLDAMKFLSSPDKHPIPRALQLTALVAFLLLLSLGSWWALYPESDVATIDAPPPALAEALAVTKVSSTPSKTAVAVSPSSSPRPARPKVATSTPQPRGRIVFELDSDVRAYVDDVFVAPEQWSGYETPPGRKRIRLVKDGFDPIENIVEVHTKKTALIRAKR